VIGVYFHDYPSPDHEEDHGVQVYRLRKGYDKYSWIFARIRQYRMIKGWVQKGEIDLIEAPDSSGWFACWGKLNVPLIMRMHGSVTYFSTLAGKKTNRISSFLEKRSYKRTDYFASVSKFTADTSKKIFGLDNPVEVIYNGIRISEVEPKQRETSLIVFSGTLVRKKGVIELVKALNILANKQIVFEMYFFGKDAPDYEFGSMKAYLEGILEPSIKDHVHFTGHLTREELFSYYSKATVAVFPSFMEAFALAPMESMAYGCPTIYSNETSGKELITSGVDGLLINPSKPEEIADALESILTNPELAKTLGENGKKKVSNFTVEQTVSNSIAFYERILSDFLKRSSDK
jgi:glycosyltransferase involved in cell wall biosynthesis